MLLCIFVIGLVSVMVLGLLRNLSVRAAISKQVENNEKSHYLAEAGIQHAASTIQQTPGFIGKLSWSDGKIKLPETTQRHSYAVTIRDDASGGKVVTSRGAVGLESKTLVRMLSGATKP